ncbi:hypothetical protein DesyoDRAFT_1810 [Desulfosporosinus youngiae DSM 17734]|uniref:Uncharacterized protein n=1 Tax=Desulfosporosinus youngiae DSM 17734 TaxID=768710 RepID=H5XTX7_9FIRM|nr:hypothetical protein DesyoDRAFT_1810 [Desulfosporosinus youngiae DSM 17734]
MRGSIWYQRVKYHQKLQVELRDLKYFDARVRQASFFNTTPFPYLAIPVKKAIIRNRWKLKSRRDLKVLAHFQARAGETAPTRNRLSTTTFLLYNAAHLSTSEVPVLWVKRV